ncbi:MAG TPA: branched-chain amino acid ABC transporter permease [Ktedonobacteraceae bacterium]|nr:branched-chain amino acid ABC transporter permease [Ktedonobacteraceae bacterium]HEV2661338.1 branched-chain amino acid ABC transporter permease [Ktedonobacteraceae bacterium]
MLLQHLIDGLFLGGLYASTALGLTLVFGVMRLVNLAHGEFLIGGCYLAYVLSAGLGLDPLISLLVVAPLMFGLAYPIQRFVLSPLMRSGQEAPLVATFGISLVAQTVFALIFGSNPKSLNAAYTLTGINILGDEVRTVYVIAFVVGLLLVAGMYLALNRLPFGKALRASAEDPVAAASVGINVQHVYAVTFGLAAAVSAIGGTLIGLSFGFTPTTGTAWLVRGFTVVVLGGLGSLWGSLVGGILIGILEEVFAGQVGPQYRDLIVFSFLVLILVIRPQGIFGKKEVAAR